MPSKSSSVVPIRLGNDLITQMDALAQRLAGADGKASRSALARDAIRRGLDQIEAELAERSAQSRGKRRPGKKPQSAVEKRAEPVGLEAFAAEVLEAARRSPSGRFGEDRLFISHAWRQYELEQSDSGLDYEAFKARLLEANRARYLSIVCADMAPLLDQVDVRESEIRYMTATFHLICI